MSDLDRAAALILDWAQAEIEYGVPARKVHDAVCSMLDRVEQRMRNTYNVPGVRYLEVYHDTPEERRVIFTSLRPNEKLDLGSGPWGHFIFEAYRHEHLARQGLHLLIEEL